VLSRAPEALRVIGTMMVMKEENNIIVKMLLERLKRDEL
jgi:nucleoside permease NupC